MKILFLQDDFPPQSFGGAGISTYELAIGMKKAGHDVFVITTCRKKDEEGESDYNGIKIFKIASSYSAKWRAYVSLYNRPVVKQVEKLLKNIKPDVVHANNIHFYLSYHCLKLARRHAKAVVFTARDVMTFNFGKLQTRRYLEKFDYKITWFDQLKQAKKRWNPFRNFFIRKYLKYADGVFAISEALKSALLKNNIKGAEVIYNGIDVDEWNADADVVADFKIKYGIANKKTLLFSGRLSALKGGAKAIEALALIVKEVPDTVLLVAGAIDEYALAMKELAKSLDVEKKLIFTGWINREGIKLAYSASDVILMPSICFDAFGRVNIEAMASKKPVIGTCYGGTPEVVVDGVTGYIVNPLYPEKIAEKTVDLLRDPKKAERFGQAGYERAVAKFNLNDIVEKYIFAYKKLMD